jgi:hypothetical protein
MSVVGVPMFWYDYYMWLHHPMTNLFEMETWNYAILKAKEICRMEDAMIADRLWYERMSWSPLMSKVMFYVRNGGELMSEIERFYSWVKTLDLENDSNWLLAVWEAQRIGVVIETIPEPIEDLLKKYTKLVLVDGQYYIIIEKGFRVFSGYSVKKFLKNEVYSVFTNLENGLMYPDRKLL